MRRALSLAAVASLIGLLAACASNAPVRAVYVPVVAGDSAPALMLSRDVTAVLGDGTIYTLPEGSRWLRVGALVQGDVYRPLDATLRAGKPAGAETYLVASAGKLWGFYLPAGGLYMPLAKRPALPFSQRQ